MRTMADIHYTVIREWSQSQRSRWWVEDKGEPIGSIKALRCTFCDFQVLKKRVRQPRTSKSGLGRYNRMRALMVQHLHAEHRDELDKLAERVSKIAPEWAR